jgi:hypothetical protein
MPIISKQVCKTILDDAESAQMVNNCLQWELVTDANNLTEEDGEKIQKYFQKTAEKGKELMASLQKP